jgi:hypothetical protein
MIAYPGVPIYFKKKTPVGDGVIQNIIPRAEQLGIISRQDVQDRFEPNKPLKPFNFEMLDKEVNKRTSIFRPKTEE